MPNKLPRKISSKQKQKIGEKKSKLNMIGI